MVRRGFTERQAQEFLKGQSIIDLIFQLGIGGNIYPVEFDDYSTGAKPFLQQQALEQEDGRIGIGAFIAGADGVMLHENRFDTGPVNGGRNLFHLPR